MTIWLRMKLLADAGIIGLPNAGKSTFLAAVSAARPKIADYPFTTLYPELGVVRSGDYDFVLADIPGLIEGAHEGAGIGDRFLGHIERCRVLLHLVDVNEEDVAEAYRTVRREMRAYGAGLDKKREIVALSKCDAVTPDYAQEQAEKLKKACRKKPLLISAVSGMNLDASLSRIGRVLKEEHDQGEQRRGDATRYAASVVAVGLERRTFNRNRLIHSICLFRHRIFSKTASRFSVRCTGQVVHLSKAAHADRRNCPS